MLVKSYAAAVRGIDAIIVTVETVVEKGMQYCIVGLPDASVKESHERVRSAIKQSGYNIGRTNVVINMAPADVRKEGSAYDLPIAIAILVGSGVINAPELDKYMIMGELSLDGSLQPVRGILPMAIAARAAGFKGMLVPSANATEAAVVDNLEVYGMDNLREVADMLSGASAPRPTVVNTREEFAVAAGNFDFDFSEVKGQENVKRAFEVACAGGHNILLIGKVNDGQAAALDNAAVEPARSAGNHQNTLSGRKTQAWLSPYGGPPFPLTAPHGIARGHGRRRLQPHARRNIPCTQRHTLSR